MVRVKVMTAASYWSLLEPAIETASLSGVYGEDGEYAFIPVSFGFAAGAAFVYAADYFLAQMVLSFQLTILLCILVAANCCLKVNVLCNYLAKVLANLNMYHNGQGGQVVSVC